MLYSMVELVAIIFNKVGHFLCIKLNTNKLISVMHITSVKKQIYFTIVIQI